MKKEWIAVHIYYSWPHEQLLSEAVLPLIEELKNKRLIKKYFYIRYSELGPHIRLRFFIERSDKEKVKTKLNTRLGLYLKNNPSKDLFAQQKDVAESGWYPNNTLQYIPYEPEFDRYGGTAAIPIAEEMFQASTDAVLTAITSNPNWTYNSAMGTAIKMHLCFSHATGMKLEELNRFYDFIFNNWLDYARGAYEYQLSGEDKADYKKKTLDLFAEAYESQKEVLIPYHQKFWNALQEEVEFEEEWVNVWIASVRKMYQDYLVLQESGKLEAPSYLGKIDTPMILGTTMSFYLYDSFIHMTNNRLGILNRDEAFLGYLIVNSIKSIEN